MYGNNMNGYAPPYGYNGYRQSGGRIWGMSHSLPSGMSRYAFSPQDTDFTSSYPTSSSLNSRRMYGDFQTNSAMGSVGNMAAMSANSLSGGPSLNNSGTNLIVNYLPQDMTDRELYALFRSIGPINTCRIMRDFKTGYSFGYGFVDFASEADSQRAIKTLNGVQVRNKRLKVSLARPGGEQIKDTNLYVTNLPRTITEEQLDVIFGKYGQIVQKNILRDKLTGKARGVAFVRFNKREEAQEAISALNNVIPEGGSQPLSVRIAEEHGKAKAHSFMTAPPVPANMNMNMNMNAYNSMVHRVFNHSGIIDGLYRKKSYHYPYL
ncbi:sex-lethal homolog isoform X2 [Episyrphus balteatus]|uniref:sex-lethal homolog isoform X2 n=1 Tax=Episyrphus balteatus TaxID=286459 RepID=UPI0024850E43|nr:sex-lethal homolog isoform X2 [Episyrphus balteatus]